MLIKLQSKSIEETADLGNKLSKLITVPFIIALYGPLGAGKTELCRSILLNFGVKKVKSPTFTIVKEYDEDFKIYHIDAYRLHSGSELMEIGFEEMLSEEALIVIEWAENVMDALPAERLEIRVAGSGNDIRDIMLQSVGNKYEHFLEDYENTSY